MINYLTLEIYNYIIEQGAQKTVSKLPKWRRKVGSGMPALNKAQDKLETTLNNAARRGRYCLTLSYFGEEDTSFIMVRSALERLDDLLEEREDLDYSK